MVSSGAASVIIPRHFMRASANMSRYDDGLTGLPEVGFRAIAYGCWHGPGSGGDMG
jgi:hypothetical protein